MILAPGAGGLRPGQHLAFGVDGRMIRSDPGLPVGRGTNLSPCPEDIGPAHAGLGDGDYQFSPGDSGGLPVLDQSVNNFCCVHECFLLSSEWLIVCVSSPDESCGQ